jgi:hypothetical protein
MTEDTYMYIICSIATIQQQKEKKRGKPYQERPEHIHKTRSLHKIKCTYEKWYIHLTKGQIHQPGCFFLCYVKLFIFIIHNKNEEYAFLVFIFTLETYKRKKKTKSETGLKNINSKQKENNTYIYMRQ